MKKFAPVGARFVLGAIFFIFGLNGFLNFLPMPPLPEEAGKFLGGLAGAGYMFPMIKGTEVLAGAMLLGNFQVPLALLLLSPIAVNIFAFHFFLTGPSTVGMAATIGILMIYLAYENRARFAPLFKKEVPGA